jgi:hypothetical protein
LRALDHPCLDLFQIELEPLGFFLRQERIEIAEPLDEAAVAGRAAVGDDDVIERPLLGAGTRHTDDKGHSVSFRYGDRIVGEITSSFPSRAGCPEI